VVRSRTTFFSRTKRCSTPAIRDFAEKHPHTNLFAFWIAKPKPKGSVPDKVIGQWQKEEDDREAAAAANGDRYYPVSALEIICHELSDARYDLSLLKPRNTTATGAPRRSALCSWARRWLMVAAFGRPSACSRAS
jgi:hypothetical protein